MKPQIAIVAAAMTFALAGTLSAQTISTTTSTGNAGAYDALPEGNRKIVSAIYESQFGSPNDTAGGTLLTRDDIAAMRQGTGWGNAYRQLYEQGLVSERNLGQAISSRNHNTTAAGGGVTVVTTAGGEQMAVGRGKSDGKAAAAAASGPARPGNENAAATRNGTGRSPVVTTAGGGAVGANAAAAHSSAGSVSRAVGNGNGNSNGQAGGKAQ